MWWFLKKSERALTMSENDSAPTMGKRSQAADRLLAQVPDLSMLENHNVAVKIWLPEEVAQTMKWVADYEGVSQSNWVRLQLTSYVYGKVAVIARQVREEKDGDKHRIMFSRGAVDRNEGRWVYLVPQLGKNTVAFKLWVSEQMRKDLDALAKHAGVGLSPFIREAVIGELYGRGSLPERPEIMGSVSEEALAWERGGEVREAEIEEDDFDGLGEAMRVWVNEKPSRQHD